MRDGYRLIAMWWWMEGDIESDDISIVEGGETDSDIWKNEGMFKEI